MCTKCRDLPRQPECFGPGQPAHSLSCIASEEISTRKLLEAEELSNRARRGKMVGFACRNRRWLIRASRRTLSPASSLANERRPGKAAAPQDSLRGGHRVGSLRLTATGRKRPWRKGGCAPALASKPPLLSAPSLEDSSASLSWPRRVKSGGAGRKRWPRASARVTAGKAPATPPALTPAGAGLREMLWRVGGHRNARGTHVAERFAGASEDGRRGRLFVNHGVNSGASRNAAH